MIAVGCADVHAPVMSAQQHDESVKDGVAGEECRRQLETANLKIKTGAESFPDTIKWQLACLTT